jgi:hypothetical protein
MYGNQREHRSVAFSEAGSRGINKVGNEHFVIVYRGIEIVFRDTR